MVKQEKKTIFIDAASQCKVTDFCITFIRDVTMEDFPVFA